MNKKTAQPLNLILFILLLLNTSAISIVSAQKEIDVLYLENGNVIRGYLVGQPDSSVIRIETLCHNIFRFEKDEISSVRKELLQKRRNRPYIPKAYGYDNITDFGLLIASGYNEKNAIFSILSTHNYTLKNGISPGLGIGLEFFEHLSVPLYTSCSWHIYTQKFSPFAAVRAGYSFAIGSPAYLWDYSINPSGGLMWSAGVGTKIWLSHRNAFVISLLYRYQGIHSVKTWEWSGDTIEILKKYNRLEFRFGFQF